MSKQLKAFWDLESLRIVHTEQTLFDDFLDSVTLHNGMYQMCFPWKDMHKLLPDNYQLCLKKLKELLHKLSKTPNIHKPYNDVIQEQIRTGVIEPVIDEETASKLCHYLPYYAVVRSDKVTTKLHIVYDASAKIADGPSLNESLNKGPKFNQDILDILV